MKTADFYITRIFNEIRDKDFSEEELTNYLRQAFEEFGQDMADLSLAQFTEKVAKFRYKRRTRLEAECSNYIIPELNADRVVRKLARAQETYKANRKQKKVKQANSR